jgi:hypothetical protein
VAALKGCAFALLLLFVAVIAAPLRLLSLDKRLARVTEPSSQMSALGH